MGGWCRAGVEACQKVLIEFATPPPTGPGTPHNLTIFQFSSGPAGNSVNCVQRVGRSGNIYMDLKELAFESILYHTWE